MGGSEGSVGVGKLQLIQHVEIKFPALSQDYSLTASFLSCPGPACPVHVATQSCLHMWCCALHTANMEGLSSWFIVLYQ